MRVIVVGANAGGATAAARLRRSRADADILVVEKGGDVSVASCGLPYYVEGLIPERSSLLVETPASLAAKYRLDLRTRHEALSIDAAGRRVVLRDLVSGTVTSEPYDKLILATGSRAWDPPIEGIDSPGILHLRGLDDADRMLSMMAAGARSALILGAGHVGCALAAAFVRRKLAVTVVESGPGVLRPVDPDIARLALLEMEARGARVLLGASLARFEPRAAGRVEAVLGSGERLVSDITVICAGARPEASLAREAGLELGERGGVAVRPDMRSSDPDIYAVGDACEPACEASGGLPCAAARGLAGPAQAQARIAADNVAALDPGWPSRYGQAPGTPLVRLWDLFVGMTGASSTELERASVPYRSVLVKAPTRASYFPGSRELVLKLLYGLDGRLLGAHAAGAEGVDRRLDVLATAMSLGATVSDLEGLALCYAPSVGTPRDPVNIAGGLAKADLARLRARA